MAKQNPQYRDSIVAASLSRRDIRVCFYCQYVFHALVHSRGTVRLLVLELKWPQQYLIAAPSQEFSQAVGLTVRPFPSRPQYLYYQKKGVSSGTCLVR